MSKLIYVADDEEDLRYLMQTFLESEGYGVKTFSTGDALLEQFMMKPADLVILDVIMPGTDGLTICQEIYRISEVPIIIVSSKGSEADRIKGISIGSDDYLVKPFSFMELFVRIKSIFRRIERQSGGIDWAMLGYGDIQINLDTRAINVNGFHIEVTPTEYDFLVYMVNSPEKAISRHDLLRDVWQMEVEVGSRVTDDLVKRLRKKLACANCNTRIETVWGYGFKLTSGV